MRIFAVSALLGPGLLILMASCVWPQPEAAAPPPSPVAAVTAPGPVALAAPPSRPAVVPVEPSASAPPAREIEFVALPFLWARMLAQPAPAGRLLLNNFSFEPTRVQAVLVLGPACSLGDPGAATEFVLPLNGTRVIPAPPGVDICWRRQLIAGETKEISRMAPWTAWSRAYTGSGLFLDAIVVTPPPVTAVAAIEKAPPPHGPAALQKFPPVEK